MAATPQEGRLLRELLAEGLTNIFNGQEAPRKEWISLYTHIYNETKSSSEADLLAFANSILQIASDSVRTSLAEISSFDAAKYVRVWQCCRKVDAFVGSLIRSRQLLLHVSPALVCAGTLACQDYVASTASLQRFLQLTLEALQELGHACTGEHCEQCPLAQMLAEPHVPEPPAVAAVRHAPTPLPRTRFTRTKNLIVPLPPLPFTVSSPHGPVGFRSLNLARVAFVLENVLSPAECAHLIAASERVGYHTLAGEFVPSMRDNDRALLMSPELAELVYARIQPFLARDPRTEGLRPFGFNSRGIWQPYRLNQLFRFCVYRAPAIGFTPHRDANFIGGENDRSVFTIMVYLNDEFEGGATNFLRSFTESERDETVEEELKRGGGFVLEQTVHPRGGLAVVFDHSILHEGAPVTKGWAHLILRWLCVLTGTGSKYFFRTDVVFRRTENPHPDESYRSHPTYRLMTRYYREAADAECQGNVALSSELYERAVSLRRNYRDELSS